MPHVIIDCSENLLPDLQAAKVCQHAFDILNNSGLFKTPDDIKTRLYGAHDFHVGTRGANGKFVHAIVHLMQGRTVEQRQELAKMLWQKLKNLVPQADSVTVDIKEIDKDTYQKG